MGGSYTLNMAARLATGVTVCTCEGHLLRGVELDGVDCEDDNKDETKYCIRYLTANDMKQSVPNLNSD